MTVEDDIIKKAKEISEKRAKAEGTPIKKLLHDPVVRKQFLHCGTCGIVKEVKE